MIRHDTLDRIYVCHICIGKLDLSGFGVLCCLLRIARPDDRRRIWLANQPHQFIAGTVRVSAVLLKSY